MWYLQGDNNHEDFLVLVREYVLHECPACAD